MKICSTCKEDKKLENFSKNIRQKDGYNNQCKACYKDIYNRNKEQILKQREEYYKSNKKIICEKQRYLYQKNPKTFKDRRKEYYKNNREKCIERSKEYSSTHKDKIKKYQKKWKQERIEEHRKYQRLWAKRRAKSDPLFKLQKNIRKSIYYHLKNKTGKSCEYLGATWEKVLNHLNKNPYGFTFGGEELDIDHIIPLSSATTEEELIQLFNYTNLQLLPSTYNRHIKKDKKFNREHFEDWLKTNLF